MVPPRTHLAIDCRDRLYVDRAWADAFDSGARRGRSTPSLAVPATTGRRPRPCFHAPGSRSTQEGGCALEPLCEPSCVRKASSNTDAGVRRRRQPDRGACRRLPADLSNRRLSYRSATARQRHRAVRLASHRRCSARLPPGTRVTVRVFTADEILTPDQSSTRWRSWRHCASADTFDEGDRWDCLVRDRIPDVICGWSWSSKATAPRHRPSARSSSSSRAEPAALPAGRVRHGAGQRRLHRPLSRAVRHAAARHRAPNRPDGAAVRSGSAPAAASDPRQTDFL